MRRLWLSCGLVLVAAIAATSLVLRPATPATVMDFGVIVDPPRALAEFELVDHRGRRFDNARLEGHWTLLFIGFTHCPDVCPATLSLLSGMDSRQLPSSGLQSVFVSVDPERDSLDVLARYVDFFGHNLVAATGHHEQLGRLCASLDFGYVKVPMGEGRYTVDHSGALALINPEGRLAGYFLPPFQLADIQSDLQRLTDT